MSESIYTPYTYLIGWSEHDLWYYGCEYASILKTANPQNLWKTYFTSSKKVSELRETLGEPDIIKIRKVFKDAESCIVWEEKVLKRMKVLQDPKWLNANVGGSSIQTEEIRAKKGKKISEKMAGRDPWNKGKTNIYSEETLNKMRKPKSEELKAKLRKPKTDSSKMGRYDRTNAVRKKLSDANKGFKWMNNGTSTKQVKPGDVEEYVNQGWVFGIASRKKRSN